MAKKELTKNEGITTEYLQEVMAHILKVLGEPSREYKDRVFRMLLNDPVVALEVYNAMNDTEYDNPEDLTITTLENATYMGMRNDVSFVIASQLMLYEHQSTVNKNMPLRNLIYVTCIYAVLTRNSNLYGRKEYYFRNLNLLFFTMEQRTFRIYQSSDCQMRMRNIPVNLILN